MYYFLGYLVICYILNFIILRLQCKYTNEFDEKFDLKALAIAWFLSPISIYLFIFTSIVIFWYSNILDRTFEFIGKIIFGAKSE